MEFELGMHGEFYKAFASIESGFSEFEDKLCFLAIERMIFWLADAIIWRFANKSTGITMFCHLRLFILTLMFLIITNNDNLWCIMCKTTLPPY